MPDLIIGTAGHIDHGKSSLVLALTGTDPDRLREEKARGITIDLGFAHWTDAGITCAFVDVPGHERFVRNMLAGVGGIDAVLLVVAADESVMPQTREHFEICRLLGIRRAVVAITKTDLAEPGLVDLVRDDVRELIAGAGWQDAPIVPVSARSGEGIETLRGVLRQLSEASPARPAGGSVRLPIDRAFTMRGFGTVVTGTLVGGTIAEGDELVILPQDRAVKVRGLQVHGRPAPRATAGHRVALNLAGVEVADAHRGQTLVEPGAYEATRRLDAHIELLASARPLAQRARVRLHQGTAEVLARVSLEGGREALIQPGTRAFVRLRLERPAVLARGDRFILRAYSPPATIAGGTVVDPHPARSSIRAARARLAAGEIDGPRGADAALEGWAQERGLHGLEIAAARRRLGLSVADLEAAVARVASSGRVERVGDVLFAAGVLQSAGEGLAARVREYHAANPLEAGMPREEARERLFTRASPIVFEHVLRDLADRGIITGRDRLAHRDHQVTLSGPEQRAVEHIERALAEGGLKPPDAAAMAERAGVDPKIVERMLTHLVRQKIVVKLDTVYFHRAALERLKDDLRGAGANATVDVAEFKNRFGVSRKYAIPLLEYLDRERVTRRVGDVRVVL
jgi:selenocysteine-specific elongation factor